MVRLTIFTASLLLFANIWAAGQAVPAISPEPTPVPTASDPAEPVQVTSPSKSPVSVENSPITASTVENLKADPARTPDSSEKDGDDAAIAAAKLTERGFQWSSATKQALMFLALQHGFALATQSKTRESLKGPFFKDYFKSVKSLHGWEDGGRFFTNYVAHPMQGSFLGWIQVQNDPKGRSERFGRSSRYWKSRAKALAWSAAWSTQFEIGPISQASIGNVGLKGKQTWIDIVMTPTLGTAMLITEDILDRFVIKRIERRTKNRYIKYFARMLLNPTRTTANTIAFKNPWHRDGGLR